MADRRGPQRFYSVQSPEAYAAALAAGSVRAAYDASDPGYRPAYAYMAEMLEQRVGSCPAEVQQAWAAQCSEGAPERPFPVWAWPAWGANGAGEPRYMYVEAPGTRNIILQFEVPAERALLSQFNAWHSVLNNCAMGLTEEEDDALEELKNADPEAYEVKKRESWANVFKTDWTGSTYLLERGEEAELQAVLWELPLSSLVGEPGLAISFGGVSLGTDATLVRYEGSLSVGEDLLALAPLWCPKDKSFRLSVAALRPEGAAAAAGVAPGWVVVGVRVPLAQGDPLPGFRKSEGTASNEDDSDGEPAAGRPAASPGGLRRLAEAVRGLSNCTLAYRPPPEHDDDSTASEWEETEDFPKGGVFCE